MELIPAQNQLSLRGMRSGRAGIPPRGGSRRVKESQRRVEKSPVLIRTESKRCGRGWEISLYKAKGIKQMSTPGGGCEWVKLLKEKEMRGEIFAARGEMAERKEDDKGDFWSGTTDEPVRRGRRARPCSGQAPMNTDTKALHRRGAEVAERCTANKRDKQVPRLVPIPSGHARDDIGGER